VDFANQTVDFVTVTGFRGFRGFREFSLFRQTPKIVLHYPKSLELLVDSSTDDQMQQQTAVVDD